MTAAADELKGKLDAVDGEIVQRDTLGGVDRLSKPSKLDAKIREIAFVPSSAEYRPTRQAYEVFEDLSGRLDVQFKALQGDHRQRPAEVRRHNPRAGDTSDQPAVREPGVTARPAG